MPKRAYIQQEEILGFRGPTLDQIGAAKQLKSPQMAIDS